MQCLRDTWIFRELIHKSEILNPSEFNFEKWAKEERSFNFIFQETALVFVKEADFGRLTQLLSPVEFARLKPLVLLLGWPYCYSCENAKNLLEALWNPTVSFVISALHSPPVSFHTHYFPNYSS